MENDNLKTESNNANVLLADSLPIEVSKILDKHLPADGIGTEREKLRMMLHSEICVLVANFR